MLRTGYGLASGYDGIPRRALELVTAGRVHAALIARAWCCCFEVRAIR